MYGNGKSKTPQRHRASRMPREATERARTRQSLRRGDWDELPSHMPARAIRRGVIAN